MTHDGRANVHDASVIHDLGYRRYEGTRAGSRAAFHALTWQGIRALLGIGRPLKAKAFPLFVAAMTLLPALGGLAMARAGGAQIQYSTLTAPQFILFMLLGAAQAPELISRDLQHRVLPLYFTRDVSRDQYSAARLLALFTVMFALILAPLLLLYLGEIGVSRDPVARFAEMRGRIGPVLAVATTSAWLIATVSAALSSLTARRAYATAAIIAVFLVTTAVVSGMHTVGNISDALALVANPLEGQRTLTMLLFGEGSRRMETITLPPIWMFLSSYFAVGMTAVSLLVWRMRRVAV